MIDESRKKVINSLVIYLIFTFAVTYGIQLIYFLSGHTYYNSEGAIDSMTLLILDISMLVPTVGMLVTRKLTKEGYKLTGKDSMLLGMYLDNGKWLVLLAAMIVPVLVIESESLLDILIFNSFDKDYPAKVLGDSVNLLPFFPFISMSSSIGCFGALGEELGWRGYMMPKLEKLMGVKAAVIVGGIIWSVWHYVAIVFGHGSGASGYIGAPWTGFLMFTISATCTNGLLTLLTKKSGSIWPAAVAHAVNNGTLSVFKCLNNTDMLPEIEKQLGVVSSVPYVIMFVIYLVILGKMEKNKKIKE